MQDDQFTPAPDADELTKLHLAASTLAGWAARTNARTGRVTTQTAGLRMIAILWVLKPDALGGISLHQLSKNIGCTDTILSRYATEFRERFGIKAIAQRSETTRRRMRRAHAAKRSI